MSAPALYLGYVAMSLDGCIADDQGGVGWLDRFAIEGEDHGYAEFLASVDALVMGRRTYDQVMGWGYPYGALPTYLLTRQPDGPLPAQVAAAGGPATLQAALEKAGARRVWIVGGGAAQRAMLDAGLPEEIRVFVMPAILGGGTPLFARGVPRDLTLETSRTRAGGVVELTYRTRN